MLPATARPGPRQRLGRVRRKSWASRSSVGALNLGAYSDRRGVIGRKTCPECGASEPLRRVGTDELEHAPGETEDEQELRAGLDRKPFIGGSRRQRQARPDVDEAAARRAQLRQRAGLLDDRALLDEIVADGEQQLRRGNIGDRVRLGAERTCRTLPQPGAIHRIEGDDLARTLAERREPGAKERADAAELRPGEHDDELLGVESPLEASAEGALRRVPPDLSGRRERRAEAVRRVEPFDCRLTPRAQSPLAEGMIGVPLQLHHASLAHAGCDAAAGRALATDRPVVASETWHRVVGGDYVRDQVAGKALRTAGGQTGAECPHSRAEKPAPPCLQRTVVAHLWHPRQSWVALRSLWQPMQRPMVKGRSCATVFIAATSPWHSAQATFARTCIR